MDKETGPELNKVVKGKGLAFDKIVEEGLLNKKTSEGWDRVGHEKAREFIYPQLFGSKLQNIEYYGDPNYHYVAVEQDDSKNGILKKQNEPFDIERKIRKIVLDMEHGIDTVVKTKLTFEGVTSSQKHTIQERAVKTYHENVCIRVKNDRGNPSEIFNFNANNFLFMVINEFSEKLERWIYIPNASLLITKVLDGSLPYDYFHEIYTKKKHTFIGVKLKHLRDVIPGIIEWKATNNQPNVLQ